MSNADSIKAKIKKLAEVEKKPFDYLLTHYFIERLMFRLSVSEYADNFVLKGGLLLYTILSEDARVTRDIDLLAQRLKNSPEELKNIFSKIASISSDDAVIYDSESITVQRIKEDADYQGVRVKLIGYLDKSRQTLQLDIGFGDVVVPSPVDIEYPSILDMKRAKLKAYSIESVVAEKFEAMIFLAEANSRMKDFYDIYAICRSFDFDGKLLCEAIAQTLKRRKTPMNEIPVIFTEDFFQMKEKQTQWQAFQRRIKSAEFMEFGDVMKVIYKFLEPIYSRILDGSAFEGRWISEQQSWI